MVPYIDFHCDTLMRAWELGEDQIKVLPDAMVDVTRLEKSGCMAQFFSIFMMPQPVEPDSDDEGYIEHLLGIFRNSLDGKLALARNLQEYRANRSAGKISGFLTLEDGRAVNGSMERLERFCKQGIRLITLTWNYVNCFGSPNSFDSTMMAQGLSSFGKDAVRRMQELGMLVDVSHLSDGGFWDVAQLTDRPFVASHSNCRALNPHARSMTDEMIRALADRGGIMGVNFSPLFLRQDIHDPGSRIEDMVRHLRHMVQVGGLEVAAVGSDLDGINGELEIGSADKMHLLFEAMERAGFHEREIEQIAWKNAERVLEVLR